MLCEQPLRVLVAPFQWALHHKATDTGPPSQKGTALCPVKPHTKSVPLRRCKRKLTDCAGRCSSNVTSGFKTNTKQYSLCSTMVPAKMIWNWMFQEKKKCEASNVLLSCQTKPIFLLMLRDSVNLFFFLKKLLQKVIPCPSRYPVSCAFLTWPCNP